jgi:phage regulator Rha-like protein
MNIHPITRHTSAKHRAGLNNFEDALHDSMLIYSLRHLAFAGNLSQEHLLNSIQRVLRICSLVGVDSKYHFKQVYIFDENSGALYLDWKMSKKGFTLLMMQIPSLNQEMAHWFWKLAEQD